MKYTLLHMNDFADWRLWLTAAGQNERQGTRGILFSDAPCALSACLAGQGVALGDSLLSSNALKRGLLVSPLDISVRSTRAYYLAVHPTKAGRPPVQAFADWLKDKLVETTQHFRSFSNGA